MSTRAVSPQGMPALGMPVVWSDAHRLHAPEHEVNMGLPIPTYERPSRADTIHQVLSEDDRFSFVPATAHGRAPIEAVHEIGLVDFLETAWPRLHELTGRAEMTAEVMLHPGLRAGMGDGPVPTTVDAELGWWCYETATPLVEGTYVAARASVDVALTAADLVLSGQPAAYGLCRPPGHHAARSVYGGFCFFNNAAVVADHIVRTTGSKVTVLDVDYHHGNGTQQIFYDRPDVQFVSLHGDPSRAYPWYTGFVEETGTGHGAGTTINVPLAAETADDEYLDRLADVCGRIATFGPSVVVLSLGVDTYWNDPISDLALTAEGYVRGGRLVRDLGLPTVVLQEGGYDIDAIGANVHAWLDGILGP